MSPWRNNTSPPEIEGGPPSTIIPAFFFPSAWRHGVFAGALRPERLFRQTHTYGAEIVGRGVPLISFPSAVFPFLSLISKWTIMQP